MPKVKPITLPLPLKWGTVNCYLVATDAGFVLIDTGSSNQRAALENELARADCKPGALQLVLLTHGDFDHTGNAAHLRAKFGAKIAMHRGDAGMAERGDIFSNRTLGNAIRRLLAPLPNQPPTRSWTIRQPARPTSKKCGGSRSIPAVYD